MFGRKKYPRIVGTNTPDVRHFRRQLRLIEWALTTVDPRTDVDAVRKLTTDHAAYRELSSSDFPGARVVVDGRRSLDPDRFTDVNLVVLGKGK